MAMMSCLVSSSISLTRSGCTKFRSAFLVISAIEITKKADLNFVQPERVKEIEDETKHDIMAMVRSLSEQCSGEAGRYVHLGATSNDIVDTASAIQISQSLNIVE